MKYSDNQLKALAATNPKELISILNSPHADVSTLTFGAEILGGEVSDESLTLPVFRKLMRHVNAVVREGSLIGIEAFYSAETPPPQDILDKLKAMSNNDPSLVIKNLSKDLLKEYSIL
jgi:hypothetical protein